MRFESLAMIGERNTPSWSASNTITLPGEVIRAKEVGDCGGLSFQLDGSADMEPRAGVDFFDTGSSPSRVIMPGTGDWGEVESTASVGSGSPPVGSTRVDSAFRCCGFLTLILRTHGLMVGVSVVVSSSLSANHMCCRAAAAAAAAAASSASA